MELDIKIEKEIIKYRLGPAFKLECCALPAMAQMAHRFALNAENLQQRKVDYEHDIKGLAKDFVLQLDAAMPEEHKLPCDEDGSFNLRAKDEASFGMAPKSTQASTSTAQSSLWKNSPCCWVCPS